MDLFSLAASTAIKQNAPLAWRMRPQNFDEIAGQAHLVQKGAPLRTSIENHAVTSMVLYGPSGSGKTTIAHIIAQNQLYKFVTLSAVSSGVGDIRKVAADAADRLKFYQQATILFVDEIHRFNKSQQDVLLPYIEDGTLILIGATTENPLYELNTALLSRVKLYILEPLAANDIKQVIRRALLDQERGLGALDLEITADANSAIVALSKGDARMALNILDTLVSSYYRAQQKLLIDAELIKKLGSLPLIKYDRQGDAHYDTISAFIKSVRGSDPDAAVFWLAVMLAGGENPEFISRRLLILAAEDIGLADLQALVIANAAAQAAHTVGMPEARILLAEATLYLATAPKSNSSITAIDSALQTVKQLDKIRVPDHIADAHHNQAGKLLGKGQDYKYPHSYGGYVRQDYLPSELRNASFYTPGSNGREKERAAFLAELKKQNRPAK